MKSILLAAMLMVFALSVPAFGAGIADVPWTQGNLNALSAFGKADVARLVNKVTRWAIPVKARDIGEFTWADLRGDGRLELAATIDVNGRKFLDELVIIRRDNSGKATYQVVRGYMITSLGRVIRDLNGDGEDELIIPTVLFQDTITWPVVYRLENGKYVRASRDFPEYYNEQVLPHLDRQIRHIRAEISAGRANQSYLVTPLMVKDKILRMLGQDPTAGLNQAYQWMKTDDPFMLLAATATFGDIPGYGEEAKVARARYDRATCERDPRMVSCRKTKQQ